MKIGDMDTVVIVRMHSGQAIMLTETTEIDNGTNTITLERAIDYLTQRADDYLDVASVNDAGDLVSSRILSRAVSTIDTIRRIKKGASA